MDKKEELKKLKKNLEKSRDLPFISSANDVVFGDGNPDAEIMFIGEAAGYYESIQHKPFVGQAGKLLDKLIESIDLKREKVYISNVIKARPPANRDPLPEEIEVFKPYLDSEIEIINPKIIVTLGRFSMGKFLPGEKITQIHGKPRKIQWCERTIVVVPMYHPAAALRTDQIMRQIKEDFKVIPEVLKKIKKEEEEERRKAEQASLF